MYAYPNQGDVGYPKLAVMHGSHTIRVAHVVIQATPLWTTIIPMTCLVAQRNNAVKQHTEVLPCTRSLVKKEHSSRPARVKRGQQVWIGQLPKGILFYRCIIMCFVCRYYVPSSFARVTATMEKNSNNMSLFDYNHANAIKIPQPSLLSKASL